MAEPQLTNGRPDPSPITSARILSEVSSLEAVINEKIAGVLVKLGGVEKAQEQFQEEITRVPTSVDKAVGNLKELLTRTRDERFNTVQEQLRTIRVQLEGIQMQFKERDTRTEQIARGNETALTAALTAAKDAVIQQNIAFTRETSKSEAGFIKQIDQLITVFQNGMKGLDDKIGIGTKALDDKLGQSTKTFDDKIATLEKQLTLIVGAGVGQTTQQKTHDTDKSFIVSVVAVGLSLVAVASLIIFNTLKT